MTEAAKRFEDLWVWQQARQMARQVYADFGEQTPAARDYGFRDQIRRAAISVMNNIAEGFERTADPNIARFFGYRERIVRRNAQHVLPGRRFGLCNGRQSS